MLFHGIQKKHLFTSKLILKAMINFMKVSFRFINKALRTEDVDVLYQFRFYIMDLSEQLELKFLQLKEKQKEVLKLYRGLKLSYDEVANFQRSIGNLISTNGYLSTSSERSVAYGFATKSAKREGVARALFEYQVDLNVVQKIVIADIREYSAFPEEAEVLVDIGASFQIDHCRFDADDDLWHIQVHATDQGADLAAEYMEYQKKKMAESNIVLMFGNLLLEMGEYAKAERYFDTILNSSNPNDEEIACIFFNFGRTHRLKGDFNRAINCYNRAYNLHMSARPKRSASAGKTLNGLGVVYSEQGKQLKAEECFQRAMKLYGKSIPKKHVDVAGTLINLGTIDCDRQDVRKKIFFKNKD
jgi:tetratricopeptide (TPR) repeat protein